MPSPLISVVIPTYNRADLLRSCLDSLAGQTLPAERFEVVVVDDGSTDATQAVCQQASARMSLQYFHIENSGISAAKNLGLFAASAPIVFFFDDDDYGDTRLLEEHLTAHRRSPQESTAVLGYTTWSPHLEVTPLMHYVTEVGQFLFAYRNLKDGQELDFTYFWGGRSSCKRSLLTRYGVFDQRFRFGCEDIELGYRLSEQGLTIIYHQSAVQYMNRPVTYQEFCRRCEKQGASQHYFAHLYPGDSIIQDYCQLADAENKWRQVMPSLGRINDRVQELEKESHGVTATDVCATRQELYDHYYLSFNGFKLKGIIQASTRSGRQEKCRSPI